jgi:undecaprenyl-diphosphatase
VPILHAIVLGIVQGLSEFLPISSSGHLLLVPWLFGWNDFANAADLEKTFDVALHLGTFVGAVAYFRHDLVAFARAAFSRNGDETNRRTAWLLVVASVPGAVIGALFESTIEEHLGQFWLIGIVLVAFGLLLLYADRLTGTREADDFRLRDALLMGTGQALALQPGVSRSGITITVGRKLGFDRDAAARLSFLMSLPIIGGAVAYKGLKLLRDGFPEGFAAPFAWGILASGVTGYVAVWGVLRLVRTHSFTPFVVYRVLLGAAVFLIAVTGLR